MQLPQKVVDVAVFLGVRMWAGAACGMAPVPPRVSGPPASPFSLCPSKSTSNNTSLRSLILQLLVEHLANNSAGLSTFACQVTLQTIQAVPEVSLMNW